jgi:hypothetical protein
LNIQHTIYHLEELSDTAGLCQVPMLLSSDKMSDNFYQKNSYALQKKLTNVSDDVTRDIVIFEFVPRGAALGGGRFIASH